MCKPLPNKTQTNTRDVLFQGTRGRSGNDHKIYTYVIEFPQPFKIFVDAMVGEIPNYFTNEYKWPKPFSTSDHSQLLHSIRQRHDTQYRV